MPEKDRVELLSFEGCPHAELALERVRRALALENSDAQIEEIEVETPERAHELRFLGSPSVRVNGVDVEPSANGRAVYGIMCRTYHYDGHADGAPSVEMIRAALCRLQT